MEGPADSPQPSGNGFPTFASVAEAEAYSDAVDDAYFEICYHLEGRLNLSLMAIHDRYANASPSKRPRMQTGVVREIVCPNGWPRDERTIVCTLVACARFRHEETCHAYTFRDAMACMVIEKEHDGTLRDCAFDPQTFQPDTPADAANARRDLLRLCDWIESRFHYGTHAGWYQAPDCFSADSDTTHLANIGIAQRYLASFPERDRNRWEQIHRRAAAAHQGNLRKWGTVGKVQHNPSPRTWTHPEVDARIIHIWPLVLRYNWTYQDLLKVLDRLVPPAIGGSDRRYPLDTVESLKVHCRTICGLTKPTKGRSADVLPEGWEIAEQLFPPMGK